MTQTFCWSPPDQPDMGYPQDRDHLDPWNVISDIHAAARKGVRPHFPQEGQSLMPRKKKTSSSEGSQGHATIHQRIARAAQLFTQEILHILGSSRLEEITSLAVGDREHPVKVAPVDRRRSAEFLKGIGRIPVRCPVPGCTARGIRSKMNFCMEHSATVPRAEQIQLREEQKASHGRSQQPPRAVPKKNPTSSRSKKAPQQAPLQA